METLPSPHAATDLSPLLYRQLVHTLTDLLPPPLDYSPEALRARNQAAVAKVAALLPVGANEIDLAAQCIAARAQAEEMLRLVRQNAGDIELVMRLNVLYGSTVRTSLSVHGRLMRVQALRQKREAIEGSANADAWTQHVAERSMLKVVDPGVQRSEGRAVACHEDNSVLGPENQICAAPGAVVDQRIAENVSENGINSQGMAFEMQMSARPRDRGAKVAGETGQPKDVREASAGWLLARLRERGRELPLNGCESPGGAD